MKRLLFAFGFLSLFSCKKEDVQPTTPSNPVEYTIEGKWLYEEEANLSNVMYIFEDGKRYTYYCGGGNCDSLYATFEAGDTNAIPGYNEYTFDNDTLIMDLNFGNIQTLPLAFECDGERINFQDPTSPDRFDWVRLGSNCN